jgi:four helix bundle protein
MPDDEKKPLRSYRDLIVWQKGMDLVVDVYRLSMKLPRSERFGLIQQMRDAVNSVPQNIAEGYGRRHRGEYVHFLGIAYGSLCELETEIIAAGRLGFITREDAGPVWSLCQEVSKMLRALRDSLEP